MLDYMHKLLPGDTFLITTEEDFKMTEEQEDAFFRTNLENPRKVSILALHEGQLIGVINFHGNDRIRIRHQGEFGMSIAKDWRALGIGRAMLTTLLEWAEQNPEIEKVCLSVFAGNTRAIALYRSLGFQEEGRQARQAKMGPGVYEDIILMGRFVK